MTRKERIKNLLYVAAMVILFVALLDSWARSEPYLVYNPTLVVELYQVEVDGSIIDVEPTLLSDGNYQLVFDLDVLTVGSHAVRARARYKNWGWVPWSDIYNIIRPSRLENPQIQSDPQ